MLCCGNTLTDFPISIRLTSLALWQSNDCPSASKVTLMNMDKYFMWIHYERLHKHNKAKHNKTVCIFLGIYCKSPLLTESYSVGSCLAVDPKWHPGQNYNEGAWYINLDKEVPHVTAQTEGHLEGRKFICKIWIIPYTVRSRFLAVTFPHINSSKSSIARPLGPFLWPGENHKYTTRPTWINSVWYCKCSCVFSIFLCCEWSLFLHEYCIPIV